MLADSVTFVYKVSSQTNKDKLKFYINNTLKGEWSGVGGGWNKLAYPVVPGNYTFKWVYEKDASGMSGNDCAWLDYITFPPLMTLTCYAGPNDYTCEENSFQCHGQATDWISVEWTTSGDGTFDDPYILEPIYTPGSDDITNGNVVLTLTAEDSEGSMADDEMTLMIIDAPATPDIPEGPDYVNLYYVTTSEYLTEAVPFADYYEWRVEPIEAGNIVGIGPTATITWNQSFLGTATISVRALNTCGEGLFSDGLEITVDNTVSISEATDEIVFNVYPNPGDGSFHIVASSGITEVKIMVYNILGEEVYHRYTNITAGEIINIGLDGYKKGLYILSVTANKIRYTEKLIIK